MTNRIVRRLVVLGAFIGLLCGLFVAPATPTHAATPQDITYLTSKAHLIGAPAIDIGADGILHVVWIESPLAQSGTPDGTTWKVMYRSVTHNADGSFNSATPPIKLRELGYNCSATLGGNPAIAVDSAGRSHVLWSERNVSCSAPGRSPTVMYLRVNDTAGTNLTAPQSIGTVVGANDTYSDEPTLDIAAPTLDVIHAVWKGNNGGAQAGIYYARSDNGGSSFAAYTAVSQVVGDNSVFYNPAVVASVSGDVHVLWTLNGNNSGRTLQSRHFVSGAWGSIESFDREPYAAHPTLALDPNSGTVYAAFEGNNANGIREIKTMYWRKSGGWSAPNIVSGSDADTSGAFFYPNIVTPGNGIVVLFYVGPYNNITEGQIVYQQSTDGGRTYSQPTTQNPIDTGSTRWPKGVIGKDPDGNARIYLAWQSRNGPVGHDLAFNNIVPPALKPQPLIRIDVDVTNNNGHSLNASRFGDSLTYTITLTNAGTVDATDLSLIDSLTPSISGLLGNVTQPQQTANTPGSSFTGATITPVPGADKKIAGNGTLLKNGGSITLSYNVTVQTKTLGSQHRANIVNTFKATATNASNGNGTAQTVYVTDSEPAVSLSRSLALAFAAYPTAKTQPIDNAAALVPGDVVVVTLVARNTGYVPLAGLVINDPLPSGLRLLPNTITARLSTTAGSTRLVVSKDSTTPLVSDGLLNGNNVNLSVTYRALVLANGGSLNMAATISTDETPTTAESTATALSRADLSAIVPPTPDASATLGLSLRAIPNTLLDTSNGTLDIVLDVHNYLTTATPDKLPVTLTLGSNPHFDYKALRACAACLSATNGVTASFISTATSKIIVGLSPLVGSSSTTVTIHIDLQNDAKSLNRSVAMRVASNYKPPTGKGVRASSNSVTLYFGTDTLSNGLDSNPTPIIAAPSRKQLRASPTAASGISARYFASNEPVSVYIVAPNGTATLVPPSKIVRAVASGGGTFSTKVPLAGLAAGTYRIVAIGGISHQIAATQVQIYS